MSNESEFRWTSAGRSDTGMVRQKNEDAFLDQPQRGLWVVADGMGGHAHGEVASRMIVDALNQLTPAANLAKLVAAARDRLQAVNRQLRTEAAVRGVQIIGSTVAVLLAHGRSCTCLWAGDSRIYLYRNGRLMQLTRDHSQIEELRALGGAAAEEALSHSARNLITRAVGADESLDIDEGNLNVEDGDLFLLCSDGLSNEVDEQQISSALASADCQKAAAMLVDMALQGGGRDNITVVVIRAEDLYSTEKTALNPAL